MTLTDTPLPLTGFLDVCDRTRIAGWAVDPAHPEHPLTLQILCNDEPLGEVSCTDARTDLEGMAPEGRCAFTWHWPFPPPHEGCRIEVVDRRHARPIGGSPTTIPPLPSALRGSVDIVDRRHVAGWVQDTLNPDRTVWLTLRLDGQPVRRFPANQFRRDLREAGFDTGRHGFEHIFTPILSPLVDHDVHLTEGDTTFGEAVTLRATGSLTDELKAHLAALVAGLDSPAECERVLTYLYRSADDLRDRAAREISRVDDRTLSRQAIRRHETAETVPPVALFVDDQVPDPDRDAGSVALLSHMIAVRALGYDVLFIPSRRIPDDTGHARLRDAGIACLGAPLFSCPEDALRRLGEGLEFVYLHRLNNAESYASLARAFAPSATLVWSIADLTSMRIRRQGVVENRPEFDRAAKVFEVRESMAAWLVDFTLTHSEVEAQWIRRTVPTADVHVVPWAVPVRTGRRRKSTRPTITFFGHFGHTPNVDAAKWLVLDILPRLRRHMPDVVCRLVGSAMPHEIHHLAGEGVEVPGFLPNLAEVFAGTDLCVAPLRFGAGIKGKVLESWAAGVPVILTSVAAEGLVDTHAKPWNAAVADTAADFAERTAQFLQKPTLGRTQITAARKILRNTWSDAALAEIFATILPPAAPFPPAVTDTIEPMLN